jgi:hypothetical protein
MYATAHRSKTLSRLVEHLRSGSMGSDEEQQRAHLAYEAALRSLDHQHRVLDEIRSRTGILLAAASLSASFLGARAFDQHGIVVLSVLALVALVTTLVLGTLVLVPREDFVFSLSGTVLYADLSDVDDRAEQHRYVAYWLDQFWDRNDGPIEKLNRRFKVAASALVAQILCWTLAISGTLN